MQSFNRLLVLTVLALSASVHSAPVGSDSDHGIAPIERGVVPTPGVDQSGVAVARSADEFDEEEISVDTSDFDAEEPSALDRRAAKKTKAAPKPKPTKAAPKPKTTKVVAPRPKTTKSATTAKASKTPKVTKTKSSKTTKATATATPSACPIKKPAKKTRTFAGRAYDFVAHLIERAGDDQEFVGWHGTNSDTAAFWASKGQIEKPVKADGFLDFLGIGTKSTKGTSGADAEIGPGLYVADNKESAIAFAINNSKLNAGTTPALCAIFAKSSVTWRTGVSKAFIPENLVGDSSDKARAAALENARLAHIQQVVKSIKTSTSVVKFALFDRKLKSGQMVLPQAIGSLFTAKCFKVEPSGQVASSDEAASNQGTSTFPGFSYNGNLRGLWNIVPEAGRPEDQPGPSC